MDTFILPLHPVLVFIVVLARVGGMVTFAPFWAHNSVSFNIKVVLAGVMALILTPFLMDHIETLPIQILPFTLIILGEMLIGIAIGFVGRLVFLCFEFAAHFVSSQMGFSLAGIIDPDTKAQTTTLGIAAQLLSLIVLLGANAHHWFLYASVKSFTVNPPGSLGFSAELIDTFLRLSADALLIGISLAAPAVIVLLVIEFGLEFFGRTAPQFQVFILGFPLKIGTGLWIIGACIYFLPTAFRDVLSSIYVNLEKIMGLM